MKKKLLLIISIVLVIAIVAGCTNIDNTLTVSQNLTKGLDNLSTTVRRLDTLNNTYIANPDIYPTSVAASLNALPNENVAINKSIKNSLQQLEETAKTDNAKTISNDIVAQKLSVSTNELTNMLMQRVLDKYLTDQNGNKYVCDKSNKYCYPCDQSGNCDTSICYPCPNGVVDTKSCYNTKDVYEATSPHTSSCADNFINPLEMKKIASKNKEVVANPLNAKFDGETSFKVDQLSAKNMADRPSDENKNTRRRRDIVERLSNENAEDKNVKQKPSLIEEKNENKSSKKVNNIENVTSAQNETDKNVLSENQKTDNIKQTNPTVSKPKIVKKEIKNEEKESNENIQNNQKLNKTNENKKENKTTLPKSVNANNNTDIVNNSDNKINNNNSEDKNTMVYDNNRGNTNMTPYRFVEYTEERVYPEALRYNPRYATNINTNDATNQLNTYIVKVQKLYAITADAVEANNMLTNHKTEVLDSISKAKTLNENLKKSEVNLNNSQIQAFNNYIKDLKMTTGRLRNSNGQLNNEINNITHNTNTGISTSIDVMNSNYVKILNHLDTRITYHKSALATLEQLKYLLEDVTKSDDAIVLENNETMDNNNINENKENNNEDTMLNDNSNINDNLQLTPDNETQSNQNNDKRDNMPDLPQFNRNDNTNSAVIDDSVLNDNSNNEKENMRNISPANDNKTNNANNNNNSGTATDNSNNADDTNDAEENNTINNNNATNANNNMNGGTANNNMANGAANNNIIGGGAANNGGIANNAGGNNNAAFRNSVINQNNLNSDRNIRNANNYYYDEHGAMYNANNNNQIAATNNQRRTNNNVDTYGYNTLLDTLNRGTVNNGINVL